jgi:hypothetical protein
MTDTSILLYSPVVVDAGKIILSKERGVPHPLIEINGKHTNITRGGGLYIVKSGIAEIAGKNKFFSAAVGQLIAFDNEELYSVAPRGHNSLELDYIIFGRIHYSGHEEGDLPFAKDNPVIEITTNRD